MDSKKDGQHSERGRGLKRINGRKFDWEIQRYTVCDIERERQNERLSERR